MARPVAKPRELLSTHGACDYLKVSKTTLRSYISKGLIHPIRLGPKLLRFDPDDLDSVLRRENG